MALWYIFLSLSLSVQSQGSQCSPTSQFVLIIFLYANVVLFNCGNANTRPRREGGGRVCKLIIDAVAFFLQAFAITDCNQSFPCSHFRTEQEAVMPPYYINQTESADELFFFFFLKVGIFIFMLNFVFITSQQGEMIVRTRLVQISCTGYVTTGLSVNHPLVCEWTEIMRYSRILQNVFLNIQVIMCMCVCVSW